MYILEEKERKYFRNNNKPNLYQSVSRRHELSPLVSRILLFSYYNIYKKHGSLIPTNNDYESVQKNEMGIRFTEDINDDYLKEIENLFVDSNYTPKYYDFLYYKNIGEEDIKKLKEKYPNLQPKTIKDVLLYAQNEDTRNKLFEYLNDKSIDFQVAFCKILIPMVIEVTSSEAIYGDSEFTDLIIKKNKNETIKKEEFDKTYIAINDKYNFKSDRLKTNNPFYISEYNNLFQEILLNILSELDEENIKIILKVKEYVLNNIPSGSGDIEKIPIYKKEYYDVDDCGPNDRENACYASHQESRLVLDRYEEKNTVCLQEEKIMKQIKAIKLLIPMLVCANIDYYELLKCDCYSYIDELIKYINSSEDVKILWK